MGSRCMSLEHCESRCDSRSTEDSEQLFKADTFSVSTVSTSPRFGTLSVDMDNNWSVTCPADWRISQHSLPLKPYKPFSTAYVQSCKYCQGVQQAPPSNALALLDCRWPMKCHVMSPESSGALSVISCMNKNESAGAGTIAPDANPGNYKWHIRLAGVSAAMLSITWT